MYSTKQKQLKFRISSRQVKKVNCSTPTTDVENCTQWNGEALRVGIVIGIATAVAIGV